MARLSKGETFVTFKAISIEKLTEMIQAHMGDTAWPNLLTPGTRTRAQEFARKNDIWTELIAALEPLPAIPVWRWSQRKDFTRTGSLAVCDQGLRERLLLTEQAALALWLEHPAANLDFLHDLLWAWCETTTWCPAGPSGGDYQLRLELVSSRIGRCLSEILRLFAKDIDSVVYQRVRAELDCRILKLAFDPHGPHGPDVWSHMWWTRSDNWNLVCNGNVIQTALNLYDDAGLLARTIHPLLGRLQYAIDGFGDDGSCFEGFGYWTYGFGQYLELAYCLMHRTGGKLNLLDDPKVKKICRFPLAMRLDESSYATFSDSGRLTHLRYELPAIINHFINAPELLTMVEKHEDGSPVVVKHGSKMSTFYWPERWRVLTLNLDASVPPYAEPAQDVHLHDYGYVRANRNGTVLAAVAGYNDMPHNHNDIGSFILRHKGTTFLTDPGAPVYDAKTFGEERYDNLFCRSLGHSVPVVNGNEQAAGKDYCGSIEEVAALPDGGWTVSMEISRAYPDETLKSLKRTFVLQEKGDLELKDQFTFASKPRTVEENFVTFESVQVSSDGRKVRIGRAEQYLSLISTCNGVFSARRLDDESKACGREPLWRISFKPTELSTDFAITFTMDFL